MIQRSVLTQSAIEHSAARVASSGSRRRQPEQDHGAIAEEARDHAAASRHFLVDQRMKLLQQSAGGVRVERLAERGKSGKIDEDDGGILPDRRQQEVGIAGQPFLKARRLELFKQLVLRGEMLRASPARP